MKLSWYIDFSFAVIIRKKYKIETKTKVNLMKEMKTFSQNTLDFKVQIRTSLVSRFLFFYITFSDKYLVLIITHF